MLFRHSFLLALATLALPLTSLHAGSLDADPFTLDPGFNGGAMRLDRFGGNNNTHRDSAGQRIVRLDDGSYVVAALVDAFGAETGTVTGVSNVGLLHLGANGQKIAWPNVSSTYTDASHHYIVVPNRLDARYTAIADIKVRGDHVYVMADHAEDGGRSDVRVLAFGLDGSYKGVMALVADERENGIGMVFGNPDGEGTRMLLVMSHEFIASSRNFIRLARYQVDANGETELDTAFGNNGFMTRAIVDCLAGGTEIGCDSLPYAATSIDKNDSGQAVTRPYVFIAGRYMQDKGDGTPARMRSFVLKTDIDGEWQIHYGPPGSGDVFSGSATYDLPGSGGANWPQDIVVRHEPGDGLVAFVLHGVYRACGMGFNVARLDGAGLDVAAAAEIPFGGSDASPCTDPVRVTTNARAMRLQGDRLAIVGTQQNYFMGFVPAQNAWLMTLDASRGRLTGSLLLQATVGDDVALGTLNGIATAGDDRLVAVGTATDTGRNERDILAVAGLRADRIFAGSFGQDRFDD